MSQIIVDRHKNGRRSVVAGWDRPSNTAFVQLFNEDGECTLEFEDRDIGEIANYLHRVGYESKSYEVKKLLEQHKYLDYPESNVIVDMTKKE